MANKQGKGTAKPLDKGSSGSKKSSKFSEKRLSTNAAIPTTNPVKPSSK